MKRKIIGICLTVGIAILLFSTVHKAAPQTENMNVTNVTQPAQIVEVRQQLIDALNKDLEDEWSSYIQYKKHSWEGEGMESPAIIELFDKVALDELQHIDKLAKRIVYLGGIPSKKVSPIVEGGDLKKMIQDDLAKENGAIKQYKDHIKLAIEEGDPTSRLMLEEILSEEESHAGTWENILGIKK